MGLSAQRALDAARDELARRVESFSATALDGAVFDRVRRMVESERFTIVLGAGASKSVGLPVWGELISRLVKKAFPTFSAELSAIANGLLVETKDPLRQVALLGDALQFRDPLLELLHESLYETYDAAGEGDVLEPISRCALHSAGDRQVTSIITYNFDDTLEACLTRLGITATVVSREAEYGHRVRGLRIFHPHGYLPRENWRDRTSALTFSEPEYHDQYRDHLSWANVVQVHHFRTRSCLFVGLSLDDPNLRRLLSIQGSGPLARELRHVAILRQSASAAANFLTTRQLELFGIQPLWIASFDQLGPAVRRCLG